MSVRPTLTEFRELRKRAAVLSGHAQSGGPMTAHRPDPGADAYP
jgi:hypothetical protein